MKQANDGEKLMNIKYFSFKFNFSEKMRVKRGGVGCQKFTFNSVNDIKVDCD